jgi:hypothetical protein
MAFDLFIWKWAEGKQAADPEDILEALSEDNPHPALTRFNMAVFESALQERFGSVNDDPDSPFMYEISDFKGVPANWMTITILWSQVESVCPAIIEIAHAQGLAAFDPQSGQVR